MFGFLNAAAHVEAIARPGSISFVARVHHQTRYPVSRRVDVVMNPPFVTPPLLVLFAERLEIGFAVGIEEVLAPLRPRGLEFGRRNVPVRPALPGDNAKVLA